MVKQRAKKMAPHAYETISLKGSSSFPWPVCRRCGFVFLKNPASIRTARKKCEVYDDDE